MRSPHYSDRRAFTLLEMLIVIAILTLLATVLIAAIGSAGTRAKVAATRSVITKIQGLLNDRREAFGRIDLKEQTQIIQATYPGASNSELARVIAAKEAYRGWFPQRGFDLYGPDHQPGKATIDDDSNGNVDDATELGWPDTDDSPIGALLRSLRASGEFNPTKHQPVTESAELLYLALTRSSALGGPTVGEEYFNTNEVKDTDGDGLKEFVDGWGRPLRVYRWPTRLIRPAAPGQESVTQAFNPTSPRAARRYVHRINPDFAGSSTVGGNVFPTLPGSPPGSGIVGVNARLLLEILPSPPAGVVRQAGVSIEQERGTPAAGTTEDPLANDPDDRLGRFGDWVNEDPNRNGTLDANEDLNGNATMDTFELFYHTPETYHVPLIVSAGPDEVLGLYEPFPSEDLNENGALDSGEDLNNNGTIDVTYGHLAQPRWGESPNWETIQGLTDNITNHNIRAGGN